MARAVSNALQATVEPTGDQLPAIIKSQEGAKVGPWVHRALHCSPSNNGAFDALYSLTAVWMRQMKAFFRLSDDFDTNQIVSRSITGAPSSSVVVQ